MHARRGRPAIQSADRRETSEPAWTPRQSPETDERRSPRPKAVSTGKRAHVSRSVVCKAHVLARLRVKLGLSGYFSSYVSSPSLRGVTTERQCAVLCLDSIFRSLGFRRAFSAVCLSLSLSLSCLAPLVFPQTQMSSEHRSVQLAVGEILSQDERDLREVEDTFKKASLLRTKQQEKDEKMHVDMAKSLEAIQSLASEARDQRRGNVEEKQQRAGAFVREILTQVSQEEKKITCPPRE